MREFSEKSSCAAGRIVKDTGKRHTGSVEGLRVIGVRIEKEEK